MKSFTTALLLFINISVFAQRKLSIVDSVMIKEVDKAVNNILDGTRRSDEYLVFRYAHDFIYVARKHAGYTMYEGTIVFNIKKQEDEVAQIKIKDVLKNKILDRCFSRSVCKPLFVYTSSDPTVAKYINPDSRYIYFVISKSNKKICEFNVPITFNLKNRDKRSAIPLEDSALHFFVYETVLNKAHDK